MPQNGSRRTVFLTGASGVVGQALVPRLVAGGSDVVCLVHSTPVDGPRVSSVHGDVTRPRLGLGAGDWLDAVSRVDAVVHAAAVTQFNGSDASLVRTNVHGTAHALELAGAADVPLHYVSSAYLHAREAGGRGRTAVRYAASKRAAEDLVRASGQPHVITRPSIVVGDSRTGLTSRFQGLHQVADAIVRGTVPILPFHPHWPVDVVPQDVVADAIATLVEQGRSEGELWLTAGATAPTLEAMVDLLVGVATAAGAQASRPRFVDPDTFDRLIAPVFLHALPPRVQQTATRMLDAFSAYLALREPMTSDLPALTATGVMALPDPLQYLRRSFEYWAERTGAADQPKGEVA